MRSAKLGHCHAVLVVQHQRIAAGLAQPGDEDIGCQGFAEDFLHFGKRRGNQVTRLVLAEPERDRIG